MRIAAFITNQFQQARHKVCIRVNAYHSRNGEGRAACHLAGKINVIVFIAADRSDPFGVLPPGVRLRYISCTPADIFKF
jgi:hypothetical protein